METNNKQDPTLLNLPHSLNKHHKLIRKIMKNNETQERRHEEVIESNEKQRNARKNNAEVRKK